MADDAGHHGHGSHVEAWPYPPVAALEVADVVIWARRNLGLETTNMDLNKIIYLIHGWTLGIHQKPLIRDTVEAWRHGPVIPAVYHEYKFLGTRPIDIAANIEVPSDPACQFVNWIRSGVESCREWSTTALRDYTHRSGSPWHTVVQKCQEDYGMVFFHEPVSEETIKAHFAKEYANLP